MTVALLPHALPPCSSFHEQNIDMDLPCHGCDFADCENKSQTHLANVKESELPPSEDGLFATQDIKKGAFVASFGRVQPLDEGLENDLGYSIPYQRDRQWASSVHDSAGGDRPEEQSTRHQPFV